MKTAQPPANLKFTETLTTNREDWSGKNIDVKVDRAKLAWEQYGYVFWLTFEEWPADLQDILGKGRYKIHGDGWAEDYILGTINCGPTAKGFNGAEFEATSDGLSRDAKDPIEAAVRLICNTV